VNRQTFNRVAVLVAAACCCASGAALAKELDQFSDRRAVLRYYAGGYRQIAGAPGPKQIDAVLDGRMNQLLDQLLQQLRRDAPASDADRDRLVRDTFQHSLLAELITPYEEWVKHEAPIPLFKVRDKGIFGHAVDYDDMRMTWYIELSPIVQAGGVLMGIDKLGHFLAQGFRYYEESRRLRMLPARTRYDAIRALGHRQETGQLGIATGGVYSFADLAANWDGMLFFMALFRDVDVEGEQHAKYFEQDTTQVYRRVRDFHWTEWTTPDWDEVLNPAHAQQPTLYRKVVDNLWRQPAPAPGKRLSICESYRSDPAGFLGASRPLRAPSRYALPARANAVAPYAIDVRQICATPPAPGR
jgi:hypothetical protein